MKIRTGYSVFVIFIISLVIAIPFARFASPLYENIFNVYSGDWIIDSGYIGTFALVYTFLISLLYRGLLKNYKGLTLFYFVLIPFLIFSVSGVDVFVAGLLLLIIGIYLGKLISSRISKN
jgi:hypothetical protein